MIYGEKRKEFLMTGGMASNPVAQMLPFVIFGVPGRLYRVGTGLIRNPAMADPAPGRFYMIDIGVWRLGGQAVGLSACVAGQMDVQGAGGIEIRQWSAYAPVEVDFGGYDVQPGDVLQLNVMQNSGAAMQFYASWEIAYVRTAEESEFDKFPGSIERGLECLISGFSWE